MSITNLIKLRWQFIVVLISLLAIFFSILFYFTGWLSTDLPLIIAMIIGGIPSSLAILIKLFKGDLGADLLAAIALITAAILHQYLAGVILILMVGSGQSLEAYAMRKASSVLFALAQRMPNFAHRKRDNKTEDIPLDQIKIDDIVVVYPHETCPVDGIVLAGHGAMDESYLTGEPYQISKAPGTEVISGAINGETPLTLRTQKLPADSRYASIVSVLQEAEQKRPNLRRLGDQIGAVFAPLALIIALCAWYFSGEAIRFLAVLVVATPCPLLIAIPIAIISAISVAAKRGIIIKDPTVLERLPTCKTAIFDKTGTLTYGKPVLTEVIIHGDFSTQFILVSVASLERYSKHPLASAIIAAAKEQHLHLHEPKSISEKPGEGLTGIVENNKIQVTHRKNLLQKHPELTETLPDIPSGLECVVLINDSYAATIHFRDVPRHDSESFISHLKPAHHFKKIMLISGDRESEVNYLGALLNLSELKASQTPQQKLEVVQAEVKKAPTLFMGDGINDAPALACATVGVAFGQSNNVIAEAAGVVIMESSLVRVDELIHLSLDTRKIALQSAVGGMVLSVVGMMFAATGYISPVAGALIQEAIDILAIVNSLRLIWATNIETDFKD